MVTEVGLFVKTCFFCFSRGAPGQVRSEHLHFFSCWICSVLVCVFFCLWLFAFFLFVLLKPGILAPVIKFVFPYLKRDYLVLSRPPVEGSEDDSRRVRK